jgi:hypothetical protein
LSSPYYLIGTISENMTFGTNPTYICKDRDVVPFAVTIKLNSSAKEEPFDVKSCKKGYTLVISDAKKYGVRDGKQGFVETAPEETRVCKMGPTLYFYDCCREKVKAQVFELET